MRPDRFMFLIIFLGLFILTFSLSAQDEADTASDSSPGAEFGLGLLLGVETFDPAVDGGEPQTFQTISLKPDLAIGKFGIGLDLVLHYRFISDAENGFDIREEDWVPQGDQTILDLYLPKITYIRWGLKGDSLYAKIGQINDASLGTGFIVSQYSNTLFQPDEKIVGLSFDMDLQMFNFPYLGFESFAGNLAHFDVFGGRLYSRPLLITNVPVIKNLEWGITVAADIDPDFRSEFYETAVNGGSAASPVLIYGSDLILPILNFDFATLALFGDIAFQNTNKGGMVGLGGRLFNIIPYIFQLRFLGDNFIPAYFDNTYDLYRGIKYDIFNYDTTVIAANTSWLGSTGFSILDDKLALNIAVDGPFALPPAGDITGHSYLEYPHLNASLNVNEGLIPDFFFSASYDKKYINEFSDLIRGDNSVISTAINYSAGAAVITLSYNMVYVEDDDPANLTWNDYDVSSSLSCTIDFF